MKKAFTVLVLIAIGLSRTLSSGAGEYSDLSSIRLQMELSLTQQESQIFDFSASAQPPQNEFTDEFAPAGQLKSPKKAFLLSLLLPGAGQYYNEAKSKAKIFAGSEASLWVAFFAFRTVGSWKKSDYKNYAVEHAGIVPEGKNDDFYERLTYYDDRDQYNQFTRLYNGPEAPIYPETDYWNWEWDSFDSRSEYRDLRNQSKNAYRRSLYMLGLAALNRVISAVDAFRDAKKFNRKKVFDAQISLQPRFNLFGSNRKISLTATKTFY
jgi:hypothetical protein